MMLGDIEGIDSDIEDVVMVKNGDEEVEDGAGKTR